MRDKSNMSEITCASDTLAPAFGSASVPVDLPPVRKEYHERQRRVDAWYAPARFGLLFHWGMFTGSPGSSTGKENPLQYNSVEEFEAAAKAPEAIAANMVAAVKKAGARYLIFTVFHSCGRYFVTYPSKVSGYRWKATQDYFGALVNRCHQEDIPLIVHMAADSNHAFNEDIPKAGGWWYLGLEDSVYQERNEPTRRIRRKSITAETAPLTKTVTKGSIACI